jgi:hypothetical protein
LSLLLLLGHRMPCYGGWGLPPRHPGTFLRSLLPALIGQFTAATTSAIALAGSRRILHFGACSLFIEVTYVCDGLDVKFESCD